MSIQDLELTVRLLGLPPLELWSRYVAVGGSSTLSALTERIAGELSWSQQEELFLAVALNDALIDESLVSLDPVGDLLVEQRPGRRSATAGQSARGRGGPPSGFVLHGIAAQLDALIERSRSTRSCARLLRRSAQEARERIAASATRAPAGGVGLRACQPVAVAADRRTPVARSATG